MIISRYIKSYIQLCHVPHRFYNKVHIGENKNSISTLPSKRNNPRIHISNFCFFFRLYYLSFLYYKINNCVYIFLQTVESYLGHLNRKIMWAINCYHVPSVVCKLFIFQSSLKTLGQFELNLTWMLLTWYFTKFVLLVYI
jgi:hypothetical protein